MGSRVSGVGGVRGTHVVGSQGWTLTRGVVGWESGCARRRRGVHRETEDEDARTAGCTKGGAPARKVVFMQDRMKWLQQGFGQSSGWLGTPPRDGAVVGNTHAGPRHLAATPAMMRQRGARHTNT